MRSTVPHRAASCHAHGSACREFDRNFIISGEWTTIAQESNARGISVLKQATQGKIAIMRQDVAHR
jgi:hypothetical protein